MDTVFAYDDNNELKYHTKSYYDLYGMFYQIVTRAVSCLKTFVLNNKPLNYKLLYVKSFGNNKDLNNENSPQAPRLRAVLALHHRNDTVRICGR